MKTTLRLGRGPLPALSDARLKTDIESVGTTVHGLPLYQFRYKDGSDRFEGVMAQDVLKVMPEAVVTGEDGFYRVHYDKLGISMTRVGRDELLNATEKTAAYRGPLVPVESDVRLKADIEVVGTTVHGLPLYRFRYKDGSDRFEGVMAQDVLKVMPEAVVTGEDGFYRVHYDKLGISMTRV